MKNIVLIGMPASGKSTVGVVLAKTLGVGFVDTDLVIQQREGRLLQDIIDKDGLKAFLEIEENALLSLVCENSVISTGGSAVFGEKAMEKLKKNAVTVFIDVSPSVLEKRLSNITTRGIAAKQGESVEDILRERLPHYKKHADFTISTENENVESSVEKIVSLLKLNN